MNVKNIDHVISEYMNIGEYPTLFWLCVKAKSQRKSESLKNTIHIPQSDKIFECNISFLKHGLTETIMQRKETRNIRIRANIAKKERHCDGETLAIFENGEPAILLRENDVVFYFDIFQAIEYELSEHEKESHPTPFLKQIQLMVYWFIPGLLRHWIRRKLRKGMAPKRLLPEDFIGSTTNVLVVFLENLAAHYQQVDVQYTPLALITHDIDFDYCQNEGLDKCMEIECDENVRSTLFFVPKSKEYKLDEGAVKKAHENGFSIGVHGYSHNGLHLNKSSDNMLKELIKAKKKFLDMGIEVRSYRSPWMLRSKVLLQNLAEAGYIFDLSYPDRDYYRAYTNQENMEGTGCNRPFTRDVSSIIVIPSTYPQDVTLLEDYGLNDEEAFMYWKLKIDYVRDMRGIFVWQTHPFHVAKREMLFRKIISYLKEKGFEFRIL